MITGHRIHTVVTTGAPGGWRLRGVPGHRSGAFCARHRPGREEFRSHKKPDVGYFHGPFPTPAGLPWSI